MKKILNTILILCGMLSACLLTGCTQKAHGPVHSIVVIHSYDNEGEEGEPFSQAMTEAFLTHGFQTDIHHIYLDLVHHSQQQVNEETFPLYVDSILNDWKPEVILLNDDPAYRYALEHNQDTVFRNYPVVFSGVNVLYPEAMAQFPNFAGFEDKIEFEENCDLCNSLTLDPTISVELDTDSTNLHDYRLYKQFQEVIKDTSRYISQTDSIGNRMVMGQDGEDDSKLCIHFFSSLENMTKLNQVQSWSFLNVKCDIVSNTFIDLNNLPDYTAIREGFNNPANVRFLAGYFTSMETQVADQVSYAVQIMNGNKPEQLPLGSHQKGYYMDYNAIGMIQEGEGQDMVQLYYDANKDFFQIVNTPFRVAHPNYYIALLAGGGILALFIMAEMIWLWLYRQRYTTNKLKQMRMEKNRLRTQVMGETSSAVWRIENGYMELPLEFVEHRHLPKKISMRRLKNRMVHPTTLTEWESIENFKDEFGWQKKRICITFSHGRSWHWCDVIYNVTPEAISSGQLVGLFINADEQIEQEQKMKKALAQAQELSLKEHFLENISSDLEKPLDETCKKAYRLTNEYQTMTKEERVRLSQEVAHGISTLLDTIDSVMNDTAKFISLTLLLGVASLLGSCQSDPDTVKVLLLHQYDGNLPGYNEFHQSLSQTFKANGYTLELRNVYLNLTDQTRGAAHISQLLANPEVLDWTPDLIMAEGDRSVKYTLDLIDGPGALYHKDKTVIFGGIANPDWEKLNAYKSVTVISDPQDLTKNIDLAQEFSHHNSVMIELDYFAEDLKLRTQLMSNLRRGHYIDNSDFHLPLHALKATGDSTVVNIVSIYDPEQNSQMPLGKDETRKFLNNIYREAERHAQLVVKNDLYCEMLSNKTSAPQFTSRRELFANGKANYLAGYFADYATVGKDMAITAMNLIKGLRNVDVIRSHAKSYYMDYDAMKQLNLDPKPYMKHYVIKNMPDEVRDPRTYWGVRAGIVLLVILLLIFLQRHNIKRQQKMRNRLNTILEDDRKLSVMALKGSRNRYISSLAELQEIIDRIDPEHEQQKEEIRKTLDVPGKYTYRIHAAMDESLHQEWWQLRYAVAMDKEGNVLTEGLLLDINEFMTQEEELRKVELLEEESKKKESFLWKIAHEIRTPLNSVQGFSQLLAEYGDDMREDERVEIVAAIQNSTDAVYKYITDIIQYAHIVSKTATYRPKKIEVSQFVHSMQDRHAGWLKRNNLQIIFVEDRDNVYIQADEEKLTGAFRQLIDNARKFTRFNTIVLGWEYKLDTREVEIFVEDSGQGIPEQKLPVLFSMFWKDDGFVPGLGIGLNIAESYVRAMNGKLQVETEEGVGSRFMMTFPVCEV